MGRLIDADAAIESLTEYGNGRAVYIGVEEAVRRIEQLPSAQPERKTGRWIKTARWGRVYYCDQCRNYLDFDGVNAGRGDANFCPMCGAKMERRQDGH